MYMYVFANNKTLLRPLPYYGREILERRSALSENSSKVFRPHYAGGI